MNPDYLAYRNLEETKRANDIREAELAEKHRAAVAEINAKELERLSRYGDAAVAYGNYDPETGQLTQYPSKYEEYSISRYIRDNLVDALKKVLGGVKA